MLRDSEKDYRKIENDFFVSILKLGIYAPRQFASLKHMVYHRRVSILKLGIYAPRRQAPRSPEPALADVSILKLGIYAPRLVMTELSEAFSYGFNPKTRNLCSATMTKVLIYTSYFYVSILKLGIYAPRPRLILYTQHS